MSFDLATTLRESARTAPDKPFMHIGRTVAADTYPREVLVLEDLPEGSTCTILTSGLRGLERPWNG